MSDTTYTVTGLHCNGCAGKVSREVSQLVGVSDATVELATGTLTVRSEAPVARETVAEAVERLGYALV